MECCKARSTDCKAPSCKGVRFGTDQEVTSEMIAAKYRAITNMEGASSFNDAQEQFASVLMAAVS